MVDYTKPQYWDESRKRWKGGAKLAADLRLQYTSKRALQRIAMQNPMLPTAKPSQFKGSSLERVLFAGMFGDRLGAKIRQRISERSEQTTGHALWENNAPSGVSPASSPLAAGGPLAAIGSMSTGMRGSGNR